MYDHELEARLDRIEAKLDRVLAGMGVDPRGFDLPAEGGRAAELGEIGELARSGKKIPAIKLYREVFGTGLKEAKEAVDRFMMHGHWPNMGPVGPSSPGSATVQLDTRMVEVERLISRGQKIQAIKLYREVHGVGLKDAKTAVEEFEETGRWW